MPRTLYYLELENSFPQDSFDKNRNVVKIFNFLKKHQFCPQNKVWSKNLILVKKFNFGRKIQF